MHLLDSFWTKVITFCGLFNFSPLQDGSQRPFVIPSHLHSTLNVVEHYPIFRPPGVPEDSKFECKYPAMPDWETCSTPEDRKCWLREKLTGKRLDIFTNYEDEIPIGVEIINILVPGFKLVGAIRMLLYPVYRGNDIRADIE